MNISEFSNRETSRGSEAWRVSLFLIAGAPLLAFFGAVPFVQSNARGIPEIICLNAISYYATACGFWAGLGMFWWRWPSTALLIPTIALPAYVAFNEFVNFLILVSGIVAVVALTTSFLRMMKGRLVLTAEDPDYEDGLQFGIKDIMLWTTVVAMFCVGIPQLFQLAARFTTVPSGTLPLIGVFAASISLNAVFGIWAMFGKCITPFKICVLIGLAATTTIAFCVVFDSLGAWRYIAILLANQVFLLATMLAARKLGYRFVV